MVDQPQQRGRDRQRLLDKAVEVLQRLIAERDAEAASGRFGVIITLERGKPRKLALLMEPTVMTAAER